MHLIVYISKFVEHSDSIETVLESIVRTAKTKNKENGVTGVLFYENGHFLQAIEGEKGTIKETYQKIEKDPRHSDIIKIIDEPVENRSLEDWNLDTFLIDTPALINTNTLVSFQKLYEQYFKLDAKNLMDFIKQMVDELDTFKIMLED